MNRIILPITHLVRQMAREGLAPRDGAEAIQMYNAREKAMAEKAGQSPLFAYPVRPYRTGRHLRNGGRNRITIVESYELK